MSVLSPTARLVIKTTATSERCTSKALQPDSADGGAE